jgi:hypothetical protein
MYGGSGCIDPCILNLGTINSVALPNFITHLVFSQGQSDSIYFAVKLSTLLHIYCFPINLIIMVYLPDTQTGNEVS